MDLSQEDDKNLLRDEKAALVEWLLKSSYVRDFCNLLSQTDLDLAKLVNESDYGITAVFYMLNREKHEPDILLEKLNNLTTEKKEIIMNALQIIEQKGIKLGKRNTLLALVKKGIITQEVADQMTKDEN